ncbi:lysylphosphatidylglycerol synthetase-like protein (DUF2156 family) [Crossiella equi]|uniref:Lysylphosphatidylglycerol synthetase-like protein (DUF2156 family) n=1 Tax=Crossiella equi TaxID=130796 RepID=A0ABS5A9B0_9PSEU|nr:hypothetical protein [Crossiella equi]MBP2473150.1 lysylphosphatidylglycerol synthetase-like protein (DUF2156 family) [Crossiella equi]
MPFIDRSPRAERQDAVTGGVAAVIAFSSAPLVWAVSRTEAGEAAFGLVGSAVVVGVVLGALVVGLVLTGLAERLSRSWRVAAVGLLGLAAGLGLVFAVATLFTGSQASVLVLGGCFLMVPAVRVAYRAVGAA